MHRNTTTDPNIVARNRANAQKSTGPKTPAGKWRSRANAIKHGLCANPALTILEDRDSFEQMHLALVDRFAPCDPVEDCLVHRIAVSLWRLQRAVRIEAAMGQAAASQHDRAQDRVSVWMDQIARAFNGLDFREVQAETGVTRHRVRRLFFAEADTFRDGHVMRDGAGLMAMAELIRGLVRQLETQAHLSIPQAQMLAWLMGESAARLEPATERPDVSSYVYPDEQPWAMPIDYLIGEARCRDHDEPLSEALLTAVETRLTCLETRAQHADWPYTQAHERATQQVAVLPDRETLDRLLRYETHAENSLHKSLETLAKLRGATVESIATRIWGPGPDGTTVEVTGQRTLWQQN